MDLYTYEDSQELLQSLDRALPYIEYALKNNKPMFEGERYLTTRFLLVDCLKKLLAVTKPLRRKPG